MRKVQNANFHVSRGSAGGAFSGLSNDMQAMLSCRSPVNVFFLVVRGWKNGSRTIRELISMINHVVDKLGYHKSSLALIVEANQ